MIMFKIGDIVTYRDEFIGDTGPIVDMRNGYIYIQNGPGSSVGIPQPSHHLIKLHDIVCDCHTCIQEDVAYVLNQEFDEVSPRPNQKVA